MSKGKQIIELSPVAFSIYGFNQIDQTSLLHYGYSVISIYGLDRTITEAEYQLLDSYFSEMLFIPRRINEQYRAFDHKKAKVTTLLEHLELSAEADCRHMILYDALRWKKLSEVLMNLFVKLDLEKVSELLSVPLELCLAIQGQVNTEFAITEMRKALFRVDYTKQPDRLPTPKNALKHNAWVTLNFGHTYTTYESLLHYCQSLVYLGAGDGEITEAEMAAVEAITTAAGTPQSIVSTLRQFDYKNATLESLLKQFVTDTYQDLDIISVYLTIRISRSSGRYGEPEMQKVKLASLRLGISETETGLLENLVALELENESLRKKLFEADHSGFV